MNQLDGSVCSVLNHAERATANGCHECCPRHAALRRASRWTIFWLTGLVAAAMLETIPGEAHSGLCGIWGCWPPLQAIAAVHLAWCMAIGATVHAARSVRTFSLKGLGALLLFVGIVGCLSVVVSDLPSWSARLTVEQQSYWPRRVLFVLATRTDLPLIPLFLTGAISLALSLRATTRVGSGSLTPTSAVSLPSVMKTASLIVAACGLTHHAGPVSAQEPVRLKPTPAPSSSESPIG